MMTRPRHLLAALALALAPATALAFDDDLDLDEDDFFDEVSRDRSSKDPRRADDGEPDDALGGDPIEGGEGGMEGDPEWDAPVEPDVIDDPIEGFEAPAGNGEDPDEGFGSEDPPEMARAAAVSAPRSDELTDDPLDDFPSERKKPAATPAPKAAAAPAGPARLTLKVADKDPLTGAFPAGVVAIDVDAVVVELPVLVARSGGDFKGGEFWLVAEVLVGGKKVGEARHLVTKAAIADLGPTVVWLKQHVPVIDPKGDITVKVSRIDGEDPPAALFTKKAAYKL